MDDLKLEISLGQGFMRVLNPGACNWIHVALTKGDYHLDEGGHNAVLDLTWDDKFWFWPTGASSVTVMICGKQFRARPVGVCDTALLGSVETTVRLDLQRRTAP